MANETISTYQYSLGDKIHEGNLTVVYRARLEESGDPVVVKLLRNPDPGLREMGKLQQEFEFGKELGDEVVARPLALQESSGAVALILEDFGGISLKDLVGSGRLAVRSFLKIARILASHLSSIHAAGIIHKDIKPQNILVNPDTNVVKLIDFGISSKLNVKTQHLGNPEVLEGTLAYVSPEQTGRMNRVVDYRTDLYSLGVTFYEVLTGRLPFENRDPMELVHSHIARMPESVHRVNSKVPEVLSDIVERLMAKNAEERYQSALGLKHDLEQCLQLLADGQIEKFELGSKDFSGVFQISQKLYGREEQLTTLLNSFDRASAGACEMMLVSGVPGVGKSALVNEVHKPITAKRGNFIAGKYDQFQRNIPYYAIQQAFEDLTQLLLTESAEQLEKWKQRILDAVGENGSVLISIIPGLENVIGAQPPVPELGAQEAQNRFNQVFQNFVRAIAQPEHPLVVFIDDLQWADSASLGLIKTLMTDPDSSYFLLIGAYRDNEVDASHPFVLTTKEIEKAQVPVHDIVLQNLTMTDVSQLVADALLVETGAIAELTGLVYNKTSGNAFFTTELLKDLYENGHLRFDFSQGWVWDVAHIGNLSITDNVVELMTQKLSRLGQATQDVIKLASCIGNKFDLNILSIIHEKDARETLEDLWPAVEESMILPLDETYRLIQQAHEVDHSEIAKATFKFAHDRVQQASNELFDEDQKKEVHLKIGRLLLSHSSEAEIEDRIFDIVNQFNEGIDLLTDPAEKLSLAEYNWKAGTRAMKSSAFQSAVTYLKLAGSTLDESTAWKEHQELIWNIYADRASAEFSSTMLDESEKDILYALERSKTEDQRVRLYQTYLGVLFLQSRHDDGVQVSRTALKSLGIKMPKKIGKAHVGYQYVRFRLALGFRKAAALLNLPVLKNQRVLNICKIIFDATPATYIVAPDAMGYICLLMARKCLAHGNSIYAPFAYVMVSVAQTGVTKEFKTADEFSRMALELNEKFPDVEVLGRVNFVHNGMPHHWRSPIADHVEYMNLSRQCFRETGNVHWRQYSVAFCRTQSILYYDKPLSEIDEENLVFYKDHFVSNDREVILNQYFLMKFIRMLRQEPMDDVPNDLDFDEEKYDREMHEPGNYVVRNYYFAFKMIEAYTFGKYEEALGFAKKSFRIVIEVLGLLLDQAARFYYVLTVLAMKDRMSFWQRLRVKIPYKLNRFLLKHAAKNCPENFQSQFTLVLAEEARVRGKEDRAEELYDQAIEEAEQAGIPFLRALSNELAGKFYLTQKKRKFAGMYLQEAYRQYTRWGAVAKTKDMVAQYPDLLRTASVTGGRVGSTRQTTTGTLHTVGTTTSTNSTGSTSGLDISTVIKATQAISGEIVLENLLAKLMKNVIENAGAERACLLMEKEGVLYLEAEDSTTMSDPIVLKSIPLAEANVPAAVIQYVFRTGQDVVLTDAASEGKFTRDEYIVENKTKSLICHPVTNQGKTMGLLYLENNLTTNAFTPDRLEVLSILASQTAISLTNSRLVAEETERQKLQKEMEMAKSVQMSILPQETEDEHYNIAAHMTPAEQVGGDYYDYYHLNGSRWIAIGDVTGHGLNSGLLMLMAQTGFSTYLNSTTQPDTKELFKAVNRTLYDNMATRTKQNLYMTFTALKADGEGNFEYVGKHEDILVWRQTTGKVETIKTDGVWMGIVPDVDTMVEKSNFRLEPGDFIILFTDGVIECRNRDREQFDTERLVGVIERHAAEGIAVVKDRIVTACFEFMDHQDDDVTLFLMQKK